MLIVKTTSLGDVIHNLPVINDIRSGMPQMQIDWVVEESFADIPRMHPGVGQVFTVAMRRWRKQLFSAATRHELSALKQQLRAQHYDLVLDTQGLLKSALIARLANAPRHGYDRKSIREPLAACLYEHTHKVPKTLHAVTRIRQLAAAALGYAAPDSLPDYGISAGTCSNLQLPQRFVIGLHGSSRDSKLWPLEHWIALAAEVHAHGLALVLPWGSQAEHKRALEIAEKSAQTIVLPRLGLQTLAAVIAGAKAAVGVDTGLMHLAVALKKTSIAIYTDTDPSLTGTCPGPDTIAINLGGIDRIPGTAAVIDCLRDQHIL